MVLHKKIRDHEFIKQRLLRGLSASRKGVWISVHKECYNEG